jgi:hypothetical protein
VCCSKGRRSGRFETGAAMDGGVMHTRTTSKTKAKTAAETAG